MEIKYDMTRVVWWLGKKSYHHIIDISKEGLIDNFEENADAKDELILLQKYENNDYNNVYSKYGYIIKPINVDEVNYDVISLEEFTNKDWDEYHKSLLGKQVILKKDKYGFIMIPVLLNKIN